MHSANVSLFSLHTVSETICDAKLDIVGGNIVRIPFLFPPPMEDLETTVQNTSAPRPTKIGTSHIGLRNFGTELL